MAWAEWRVVRALCDASAEAVAPFLLDELLQFELELRAVLIGEPRGLSRALLAYNAVIHSDIRSIYNRHTTYSENWIAFPDERAEFEAIMRRISGLLSYAIFGLQPAYGEVHSVRSAILRWLAAFRTATPL